MAARRSGSFSRRRKDRNRGWTRDNEEGKSRRKGRTTTNSKDSRVFFSEEDSVRESSRENKGKGTRRDGTPTVKSRKRAEESEERDKFRREHKRAREDTLDAYIDYRVRCLEP